MKPLCIELFCGMFGWSAGWLDMGGRVVGFDIEHLPHHGAVPDGAELVLQDVLTLDGPQFKDADLILCSPPCQEYSYMAMPWKLAKAKAAAIRADESGAALAKLTALFDACFRIQREASAAAGRHIPMVVENVKGAQPWVGRAQANYGSFYLWGDVRSIGGRIVAAHQVQFGAPGVRAMRAVKVPGLNFHEHEKTGKPGRSFQSAAVDGVKLCAQTRGLPNFQKGDPRRVSGAGVNRKAASAQIAKIPYELSAHIARCFMPQKEAVA